MSADDHPFPEFPPGDWRLVVDPPRRGAWNMAVDEAILEAAGRGDVSPTLRLYAWEPACLSLGYAQPYGEADLDSLNENGWEMVRRPTGGRAILHVDELTYSVAGPQEEARLSGSVLESYRLLSSALLRALELLGIPAVALPKKDQDPDENPNAGINPVCFDIPSHYEITVHGKKLIGSAQARRKNGVLQHGSLPLHGDLRRITQALVYPGPIERKLAGERLLQRAVTAESVLGAAPSWSTAAQAFITAFEERLNVKLQPGNLSPAELERAGELVLEKYAHPAWTRKI